MKHLIPLVALGSMAVMVGLSMLPLAGCSSEQTLYEGRRDPRIDPQPFVLVRLTDAGPEPARVELGHDGGGVAFLNDTSGRVVSVRFPDHGIPADCGRTSGFVSDERATW